ncbi:MAG TPA: hypothetical protein VFQ38_23575 [Longimicrobiales bacterium]|nr:hypothetical protein [Longimicrobiales bacterium]
MTRRTLAALLLAASPVAAQTAGKPVTIPTRYVEDRFYARPVTTRGDTLNLFTDTGGGLFLFADAVQRYAPKVETMMMDRDTLRVVPLPAFGPGLGIPAPAGTPRGLMPVQPASARVWFNETWSGMLGQQWFAERVWTWDYPGRRLLLRARGDVPSVAAEHRVRLGFQKDRNGKHRTWFPRIRATVDGEELDFLFDTGATVFLTDSARAALRDGRPGERAASFVTVSVYRRWRARHPGWRVIPRAEQRTGADLIEVPEVKVGGYSVGPVWFALRQDEAFHVWMAQWMDRPVEGALGGSALRGLRITVDYPGEMAYFEKPAGGRP